MIRGTTPTHIFTIQQDLSLFKDVIITYFQDDKAVIEKRLSDCVVQDNSLSLTLSQEETLEFKDDCIVLIQIKGLTTEGKVLATKIQKIPVERILNEEVME